MTPPAVSFERFLEACKVNPYMQDVGEVAPDTWLLADCSIDWDEFYYFTSDLGAKLGVSWRENGFVPDKYLTPVSCDTHNERFMLSSPPDLTIRELYSFLRDAMVPL